MATDFYIIIIIRSALRSSSRSEGAKESNDIVLDLGPAKGECD